MIYTIKPKFATLVYKKLELSEMVLEDSKA